MARTIGDGRVRGVCVERRRCGHEDAIEGVRSDEQEFAPGALACVVRSRRILPVGNAALVRERDGAAVCRLVERALPDGVRLGARRGRFRQGRSVSVGAQA